MSPKYLFPLFTLSLLLFSACSNEHEKRVSGQHFQGQDCLNCHNVDLKKSSHLSFGVTVFQEEPNTDNYDKLDTYCNIPMFLQLIQSSDSTVIFDSSLTNDISSPGFNGDGNVFGLLQNKTLPKGAFLINIVNQEGDLIIDSGLTHQFNGDYNSQKTDEALDNNRYSCNACHRINGQQPPLHTSNTCRK